jgi:hypothetical protein
MPITIKNFRTHFKKIKLFKNQINFLGSIILYLVTDAITTASIIIIIIIITPPPLSHTSLLKY